MLTLADDRLRTCPALGDKGSGMLCLGVLGSSVLLQRRILMSFQSSWPMPSSAQPAAYLHYSTPSRISDIPFAFGLLCSVLLFKL